MKSNYNYSNSTLPNSKPMYLHKYISPLQRPLTDEENKIRDICTGLSTSEDWAIKIASEEMALNVNPGVVLVPIPSSRGYATDNLKLAKAIAKIAGCEVLDVLVSNPREKQHARRRSGITGYKLDDIETKLKHPVVTSNNIVLIDNVRISGNTINSAIKVLPGATYLVYAEGDEVLPQKDFTLTS